MSAAHPTADSRPRAAMLSSALQPASTITTASLAPGPPTPACTLEPGTLSHTSIHLYKQAHSELYTCIHSCRHRTQTLHVTVACIVHTQKNAPSLVQKTIQGLYNLHYIMLGLSSDFLT